MDFLTFLVRYPLCFDRNSIGINFRRWRSRGPCFLDSPRDPQRSFRICYVMDVLDPNDPVLSWRFKLRCCFNQLDHFRKRNFEPTHVTTTFGLMTFIIILLFIIFENKVKNSLEILSIIGGGAMFLISMLFVFMTVWALAHGAHIATHFSWSAFKPSFSLHYFSTTGLLIFAMSWAELAAPYISRLKNPRKDFHKAMWH